MHFESYPSLHEILIDLIVYEERALGLFKTPETGAVYTYKAWRDRQEDYRDSEDVFPNYEKAAAHAHDSWERDEVSEIKYKKIYLDYGRSIEVDSDYDGNPYSIYHYGPDWTDVLPDALGMAMFDDLFFVDIPMPFKRGDILVFRDYPRKNDHVFVLDSLVQDDKELYQRRLEGKMSDGTDLMGWGFFVSDEGGLYDDHAGMQDYYNYYQGKLKGNQRLLHYVSLFLKEEIGLTELLNMQCRLTAEHQLANNFGVWGGEIPENLLAENRLTDKEKEQIKAGEKLAPWVSDKLSIHEVEFLVKEFGGSMESVQNELVHQGGGYMSRCA
jgi:hypothetical protein